MRRAIAMCFFLPLLIGCTGEHSVGTTPPAAFQYHAYDTTGTLLVKGWCTIVIRDSSHVSGEWHFAKMIDRQNIGPQFGDGQLAGAFYQGALWINLNPGYVDNNVFLNGHFSEHAYSGSWSWSGFPGVLNRGSFQALKP